jgi:hypothetical protein
LCFHQLIISQYHIHWRTDIMGHIIQKFCFGFSSSKNNVAYRPPSPSGNNVTK